LQSFTNLGAGTSQFVISPNQGVSDIVLTLTTGTVTGAVTNIALPAGWAYSMINRVSVRYGSSAQYFWTSQQLLLENLIDCENSQKQTDLLNLGGNAVLNGVGINGAVGYVYLKLPHNSVRAAGKPLPFPSDLNSAAAAA